MNRNLWLALAVLVGIRNGLTPAATPPPGLYLRGTVLHHAGRPFRGIGANVFDLFARSLHDPCDRSGETVLAALAARDIPFVRFMAGGFWPVDWELYGRDPNAYFGRLDRVVAAAEVSGIGLIPSLFWHVATVPDLVGEPVDCLGRPGSRSLAFIARYTAEVVTRYRASPALWAWEFGNEYNLQVDLPNAAGHRPPVVPERGTPARRSARDELTARSLATALEVFAAAVRRHDPDRLLSTGHALPRAAAWHNSHGRTWDRDSPAQGEIVLARDHPPAYGLLSVHVYPKPARAWPGGAASLDQTLAWLSDCARRLGRVPFVGEFAVPGDPNAANYRGDWDRLLDTLVRREIPLAAFWVYDYPAQESTWSVSPVNARRIVLEAVVRANRRLRGNGRAVPTTNPECPSPSLYPGRSRP